MPTVLERGPYRFFFYGNEGAERPHIHVQREKGLAKVWLDPPRSGSAGGFSDVEMRRIERIVGEEHGLLLKAWNDFFEH